MNPQQAKELGRRLSARREELGLTVRDVERLAGVDDATVARLENGAVADPRPATIRAICDALDLVVADVYPLADYPGSLPNFRPYLRTKYRRLPGARRGRTTRRRTNELIERRETCTRRNPQSRIAAPSPLSAAYWQCYG